MNPQRAQKPLAEVLPALMDERDLSLRGLARRARVDASHLSRIISGDYTSPPSAELLARISDALELDAGYFIEARVAALHDRILKDPELRDRLYEELSG